MNIESKSTKYVLIVMNSDPSNNLVQRRFNDRSTSDEYYERFNRNQYYNAVEDEQIYMDEYTTLLHHYNDFIVTGNAMFSRMEQTLRENIARSHVRQSFYYHRYNDLIRARTQLPLMQPPVPLNTMPPSPAIPHSPSAAAAPAPAPQREEPIRPRDNTSPQPQLPSANRLAEVFPRLLSRYFTSELNRESREINNNRENLFSMLYTVPVAIRTTGAVGGGGGGGAAATGAPTNDQINRATLNTVFSHIISPVNATCPISRDEFNDESEITMIRGCNHIFNRESLREWFVSHSTCPMCRSDIREYRAQPSQPSQPPQQEQPVRHAFADNISNVSIDRVDQDEITFSYDLPIEYNDDQVYQNIVNSIVEMAQTARRNNNNDRDNRININNDNDRRDGRNDDDDDIMEVD
jgi:hypothetical protein